MVAGTPCCFVAALVTLLAGGTGAASTPQRWGPKSNRLGEDLREMLDGAYPFMVTACRMALEDAVVCVKDAGTKLAADNPDAPMAVQESCRCIQVAGQFRACFIENYEQISSIFCLQPCDRENAAFPRRYRVFEPPPTGRGELPNLSPVIEVQGRPSLGAKKVGTIPTESRQWPRSYVVVSVDKETWVKDKLWVHLANPWIFNAKAAWLLAQHGDKALMEQLCPNDAFEANVDFSRWRPELAISPNKDAPKAPKGERAPKNPSQAKSLAWRGLGCGEMNATVTYIGRERTPILMVDNVLPLRTATYLRNFILNRRTLTDFSGAGFPGHQGKPPKWYYNAFMQCLGGIVLETFGMNVAGKRPGGLKGKKCPKDMTPPEKDPAYRLVPPGIHKSTVRPSEEKVYKRFSSPLRPDYFNAFIGLVKPRKLPKKWDEAGGTYGLHSHFDGFHSGSIFEGLASVYFINGNRERNCKLKLGDLRKNESCRIWPDDHPGTGFYRDRASRTERVRMGTEAAHFRVEQELRNHLWGAVKRKSRKKTPLGPSNEYEELIHHSVFRFNSAYIYPYGILHSQYLDGPTVKRLVDDPAEGRLSINQFFKEEEAPMNSKMFNWHVQNGVSCSEGYCTEAVPDGKGGMETADYIPLSVAY